jgi:hypothetical protein
MAATSPEQREDVSDPINLRGPILLPLLCQREQRT